MQTSNNGEHQHSEQSKESIKVPQLADTQLKPISLSEIDIILFTEK